jgi:hypothetical protein
MNEMDSSATIPRTPPAAEASSGAPPVCIVATPDCPGVCPQHQGLCWYCLHTVRFGPNFRFLERMRPLQEEDAPPVPDCIDPRDPRGRRHKVIVLTERLPYLLQAHLVCDWLKNHAVDVPESVDDLEFLWGFDELLDELGEIPDPGYPGERRDDADDYPGDEEVR